jgi:hypothetical protein
MRILKAKVRTYPETLSTFKISGIFGLQGGFRIDSKAKSSYWFVVISLSAESKQESQQITEL